QQRIRGYNDSLQIQTERVRKKLKEGKLNLPKVTYVEQLPEAVQVGQPFIDFTGETPDGKSISLSEIVRNNKLVMLDFWASWCAPCIQSMPGLVDIYKEYKEKGLEIIGISSDENAQRWKDAIQKHGMNWLQIRSAGEDRIGQDYVIKFIPYTILIGQDGKIIARCLKGDELREKIQEVLK
ncbi:MAG: TlpA family protein disulfide reductase, partial [Odoribacter sp.]|nr:TlpA family protein disulfide reductase [Odoribacter sp.]